MREIQNVLNESLAQKGTSANDYVDTDGQRGGFLALLRVYGREGEPSGVRDADQENGVGATRDAFLSHV